MGGGITYNVMVAQPGLVKAAVCIRAVSSDASDNFNRWTRKESPVADRDHPRVRRSERNPAFWRNLSR
jgi:hypothetical protein